MSEQQSSYKSIIKATSIFGGVQVFNIIISILRAKFIAVLIGPAGIGLFGLLTSTLGMISSLTSFGLGASGIKEVATANENSKQSRLLEVTGILNKLVWYTGFLGSFLTFAFSPVLSKVTFDNYNYTWTFILLSVTICIGQVSIGKDAILQGTRNLKRLAYANILSSALSLIVTFPIYYYYGIDGIVPAIIAVSFITLIVTQFYYSRLKLILPSTNFKLVLRQGKGMLHLGIFLSLSAIVTAIAAYFVRIFITRFGGLEQVGYFNAGFGIINSYVGIVFTAMATDYYPRLAGANNDQSKLSMIVNQQGIIALLILGPILTAFIICVKFAILLLYSKEFLPTESMMQYGIVGIYFKAPSWLLGYVLLASGDTKKYFWSEFSAVMYQAVLSCAGYYWWGLDGLAYAFIAGYVIFLIQMMIITRYKYSLKFNNLFLQIFILQTLIGIFALIVMKLTDNSVLQFSVGAFLFLSSLIFSIYKFNEIVKIREIISKFLKKP